jgi:rRNA maturation endonuclease Nob1
MTRKQKKAKKKENKVFYEANRLHNRENPEVVAEIRKKHEAEARLRKNKRNVVKSNRIIREKKRTKARKKGKSPNLREVDMWGLIVPLYVTPSKLKMVHGGKS